MPRAWPVVDWPREAVTAEATEVILRLSTPLTEHREAARALTRAAAEAVLAQWLPEVRWVLQTEPGRAPEVRAEAGGGVPVGLSIAHAPGCSLVALGRRCRVGVDVCVPQPMPDLWSVSRDYLGDSVVEELRLAPPNRREHLFFEHWTALEAALKCQGRALVERALAPLSVFHGVEVKRIFSGDLAVAAVAWYEQSPQA